MPEQVRPLTTSPLSQESRNAIVGSANVSGQGLTGSNLLSPITPSETEIKNLQTLKENQASLVDLQSGIIGINQNINELNSGLVSIATLLQQDAVNEQNLLKTQQENDRRLAEEEIRIGKESEIEKKIQSAIVEPVQRIAPKVQDLFGNVLNSLSYLFGGWLTSQVINYIKEEGKGNTDRLDQIKNNVLKNLTLAGGTLLAIKVGFNVLKTSLLNKLLFS